MVNKQSQTSKFSITRTGVVLSTVRGKAILVMSQWHCLINLIWARARPESRGSAGAAGPWDWDQRDMGSSGSALADSENSNQIGCEIDLVGSWSSRNCNSRNCLVGSIINIFQVSAIISKKEEDGGAL